MIFETKVNGIPCQCEVIRFTAPTPMKVGSWSRETEPPTKGDFEYNILDLKGNRAEWLEKYLTPDDHQRLLHEFQIETLEDRYL